MLCFTFLNLNAQNTPLNLIPQPVEIQQMSGTFMLSKATTISYNKVDAKGTAELFLQKINTPTGFMLNAKEGKTGNIQFNLNDAPNAQLGKEGYTFEATPKGIIITANQTAGLFYGLQTLLQLLPKEIESKAFVNANWAIPAVKITDYPRFGWRGIMLDVSRNFFTKAEVKKYIDDLARLKYNTFHWHLTDDEGWRIEIKSLPKLTEIGAWRVPRAGHFGDRSEFR